MNYDPNKNKSMGYDPIPSTGNNTGYYMGQDSNLMNMMQTGGQATRGGAAFARALQFQKDQERLDEAAEKEGRRQKRGGLFGSIGGLLGGVAGAALAPLTGGLSIPVAAGIGSALGKGAGEFLGAGKATEVDTEGTVFAQDAFGDVEEAGRDFNQGILGRAGAAGLKTGFTAGLTPGGGIYGKAGKFGEGLKAGNLAGSVPVSDTALANIDTLSAPIFDTKGISQTANVFDPMTGSRIGALADRDFFTEGGLKQTLERLNPPSLENTDLLSDYFGSLKDVPDYLSNADYSMPLVDGGSLQFEDGGEVQNYQYGGFTSEDVLESQGLQLSDEQKKLFQSFDPTQIQRTTQDLSQGLLGMTSGQGLSSQGGGFGAQQRNISQALDQSQQALQGQIASAQRDFESQTLGTAADIVAGGGEIEEIVDPPEPPSYNTLGLNVQNPYQAAIDNANFQFNQANPDGTEVGETATDINGNVFRWNGTEWVYSSEG